ncbi:hypothetical protein Ahy_B09g097987 [Arachis hypogaea]|uniref:Uncharacterized protein n=1 Tax=Arachis hypogaea TaxID=3818 RepID=A0A444XQE0_ARAHY|nr:hypothetical protein Ahy_B09g097987 [Arachis hypogaea]
MNYFKKNFEFDNTTSIKWTLRTLGQYFYPNKRKIEILITNLLDIPPVEWTSFVNHYMDSKTKKQCLQNAKNREKLIISYVGESKNSARRVTQMCYYNIVIKLENNWEGLYIEARAFAQDQERTVTEGIHSKVFSHPDDAIKKFCGPENGKRVGDFSNATYPSDFGKSKCIFRVTTCRGTSSTS